MTLDEILDLTLSQFNARLQDIFTIHSHFNSEKGKGRMKKRTFKDTQEMIKQKGISPPNKFGIVSN